MNEQSDIDVYDVITIALENLANARKTLKLMLEDHGEGLTDQEIRKINCIRASTKLIIYSLRDVGMNVIDRAQTQAQTQDPTQDPTQYPTQDIDDKNVEDESEKNGKRKMDSLHDFMKRAKIDNPSNSTGGAC